jgi:thiol-disulfide isomerase/thioredoxin
MTSRYALLVIPVAMVAAFLWLKSGSTVPQLAVRELAQVPVRIQAPYNEAANADADVAAAFARAKISGKRVLIDLGGNWCPDCIVLANVMELPELKPWLQAHYEIVAVDVGRFDRNLQVPARFGITQRLKGVPTVLVATPDGRLVNDGDPFTLANAATMSPQAIADWLAQWVGNPTN